jgi:hypothetical protein
MAAFHAYNQLVSDAFRLQFKGPRPAAPIDALVDWNGYRLPAPGRTFRADELRAIATANGRPLSAALLHKWRLWRFLPGPTAGGPTGKGRGKGQTWPEGAGWRTAWVARWLTDSLTYDAIRLALWPWTRTLERDRIDEVVRSLKAFVAQDRDYHDRLSAVPSIQANPGAVAYAALMSGDTDPAILDATVAGLKDSRTGLGLPPRDPRYRDIRGRIGQLSFDALEEDLARVDPVTARSYIAAFRESLAAHEQVLTAMFWDSPLSLARIVVRELFFWIGDDPDQ